MTWVRTMVALLLVVAISVPVFFFAVRYTEVRQSVRRLDAEIAQLDEELAATKATEEAYQQKLVRHVQQGYPIESAFRFWTLLDEERQREVVDLVREQLDDPDREKRRYAIQLVEEAPVVRVDGFQEHGPEIVEKIARMMKDPELQYDCLNAMRRIGSQGAVGLPHLSKIMEEGSEESASLAATAMLYIDPKQDVSAHYARVIRDGPMTLEDMRDYLSRVVSEQRVLEIYVDVRKKLAEGEGDVP